MDKAQRKKINGLVRGIKILGFGLMLAVMGFIGLLWFARPDTSVVEKRDLAEFPELSWSAFWDGSYFKDIDTWYADTFPLREGLISGSQTMEHLYGIRSDQIVGETMTADDIPDPDASGEEVQAAEPEEILPDGTVKEIGEMQGQIYITGNSGYGLYYFTQPAADKFAATMNQVYANVKDKVNM